VQVRRMMLPSIEQPCRPTTPAPTLTIASPVGVLAIVVVVFQFFWYIPSC